MYSICEHQIKLVDFCTVRIEAKANNKTVEVEKCKILNKDLFNCRVLINENYVGLISRSDKDILFEDMLK